MKTQTFTIDNSDGKTSQLLVSAYPIFDFLRHQAQVRVYNVSALSVNGLLENEFYSTLIISQGNQAQTSSFYIPIKQAKYRIEITITSEIDNDGIDYFILNKA